MKQALCSAIFGALLIGQAASAAAPVQSPLKQGTFSGRYNGNTAYLTLVANPTGIAVNGTGGCDGFFAVSSSDKNVYNENKDGTPNYCSIRVMSNTSLVLSGGEWSVLYSFYSSGNSLTTCKAQLITSYYVYNFKGVAPTEAAAKKQINAQCLQYSINPYYCNEYAANAECQ